MLPKLFAKKFLGIDIGASSIKLVELKESGQGFDLENYGQINADFVEVKSEPSKKTLTDFSAQEIAEMIQELLSETKIKTRQCAFAIPDFSTFFTTFSLPPMTRKESFDAVMFEARQHIPLPIESVTIDWQLIGGEFGKSDKLEVAVTAIPNEVIAKYKEIALKAKLQVLLMEAEAFGLAQALIPKEEARAICLIDIGVQSTVCTLVEKHILRYSHSFDRGLNYLVEEFIKRLPINREMGQFIKETHGLGVVSLIDPEIKEEMEKILKEAFMPIFREIEMVLEDYRRLAGIEVAKIILSGGASSVLETKNHFQDYFKKETEIADPFKEIGFPKEIEAEIKNVGPLYAVAVGMARRGFEFFKNQK